MMLTVEAHLVTIVVPVYNGSRVIGRCLETLLNQKYTKREVIVVNDGSTDDTKDIVKRYPVRLIDTWHGGVAHARNVGWMSAAGDIVAHCDDDAVYDPCYIENAVAHFEDQSVGGVIGPHYVLNKNNFITRCKDVERRTNFADYKPFTGWVYRRSVLEMIGGYDEKLEYGEDVDVGIRARNAGYRIVFEPKAIWLHEEPDALASFLRRRFRGGAGIIPFNKKYGLPTLRIRFLIWNLILAISLILSIINIKILIVSAVLFLYILVGGLHVAKLKWLRKAIKVTNQPFYSFGWIVLDWLGSLASSLGAINRLVMERVSTRLPNSS